MRAFVFGKDVDTTLVPFGFRPLCGQERVDDLQRLVDGVHAAADAHHLCIVVLTGQRCRLDAPRQRTADTGNLVGGDLLAVTRTADHDAKTLRVGERLFRRGDTEGGVVVLGLVDVGPAVGRLVAGFAKVLDDGLLEFEARVVRAQVDAHGGHSGRRTQPTVMASSRALMNAADVTGSSPDTRPIGGVSGVTTASWLAS